ncbi:MAG: hypothetical protein APR53_07085 [Methanoculleus sp. SDB]|nr:MAG: hypothetical protein APR53_07085 [Methanoculleus sp. SDB]
MDSDENPHITFRGERVNFDSYLKYAYKDGSGWHFELIERSYNCKPSLDLDSSGNPHILSDIDLGYSSGPYVLKYYSGILNETPTVIQLPSCSAPPLDPDQDGLYEDVNGDTLFSFGDIRLFFEYYDVWIPANEPIECFDYDGNGFIGFGDVRALFWMWGT